MFRSVRRDGVVLILLSGVVGLLLILATALLQATRGWARGAGARAAAAEARLAAAGGVDYAAARLLADPFPAHGIDGTSRTGDWTFRDPAETDLALSLNPSYARSEPWLDVTSVPDGIDNDGDEEIDEAVERDRIYAVQGKIRDPFADLDGDGRHSAWSGRIRGGSASRDLRFALKIESSEGKLPLNAGYLTPGERDGLDNDGDMQVDEPGEDRNGNAVPDFRDPGFPFHQGVIHVLNNLGAILRPVAPADPAQTGGWTRRWRIPAGADIDGDGKPDGEAVEASLLGEDLLAGRPAGGYRGWDPVRRVLESFGYRPDEIDLFRPHLDPGVPPARGEGGRIRLGDASAPYSAPLCAWAASPIVLEAHWRYLASSPPLWSEMSSVGVRVTIPARDFPSEPSGWDERCPHTRLPFMDFASAPGPPYMTSLCLILFPAEASRLADEVRLFRQRREGGWLAFRDRLHRRASRIFSEDFQALESAAPAPADVMKWSWAAAKANLAFQSAAVDPYPTPSPGFHPSAVGSTWGIDADRDRSGIQPAMSVSVEDITRMRHPFLWSPGSPAPWGGDPASPFRASERGSALYPPGLTLAAPSRFEVASRGFWSGGGGCVLQGSLVTGDLLELSSQEDFERIEPPRRLSAFGIDVLDLPSAEERKDGAAGFRPNVVTLPEWDRRSFGSSAGFPRGYGAVGPAPAEAGSLGSAQLYWPFTQDFDPENSASMPPWREFWSAFQAIPNPPWETGFGKPKPPYRFAPSAPAPYGFSGSAVPCQMPGTIPEQIVIPTGVTWNTIQGLSIEAWMGANASMVFSVPGTWNGMTITARRGSRNGGKTLGTELVVWCLWSLWDTPSGMPGVLASKTRSWLVEDPPSGPVWTRHVVLTLERVPSGLAIPSYKTRFRLRVDGSNASADGPMEFLFDATEPMPPLTNPQVPPWSEMGEMLCAGPKQIVLAGVDEVRLYDRALQASPPVGARYVPSGLFLSPLYSPRSRCRLSLAQWTGIAPEGAAIDVRVQGFWDRWGSDLAAEVPLADPSRPADLAALGMPDGIRSFRYVVELRSGNLAEPPLFESIWLLLRRRGASPAWTAWESH